MKKNRQILLITSLLLITVIGGFLVYYKGSNILHGPELLVFILVILFGLIAFIRALKRDNDEKDGVTVDDELSNKIKYKAGYHAYMASMYMWLFIFILKDKFPDTEIMLGGGIMLSALIAFISKVIIKRKLNE